MSGLTDAEPITMSQVVNSINVIPGDAILLRGDVFDKDYSFHFNGTQESNITVKPYPNETPRINGGLGIDGSYTTIRDVEIYWDGWLSRLSSQASSDPSDLIRKTLGGNSTNLKLINCIIRDLGSPFFGTSMLNLELYGCVIYHNGWSAPDRGHGHGIYVQNSTGIKTIKDCIIFNNFGWGIHAYSSSGNNLKNLIFEGNTCFGSGKLHSASYPNFLLGSGSGQADNCQFVANMSYGAGGLQFYEDGASGVVLTDNYMPDGITGIYAATTETGNYWGPEVGNRVFVRPNEYQTDRANVTIYNQDLANSITVDLSGVTGLVAGDSILARNVQDYFSDIQTLTLDENKTVIISMQSRTVAAPIAWTAPATTFPAFGCFVIEKA